MERWRGWSGAVAAGVMMAAVITGCASSSSGKAASGGSSTGPVSTTSGASDLQSAYESVISTTLPSIVQINTSSGLGSGIVLDAKGDIVTNAHVVGTAKTFT